MILYNYFCIVVRADQVFTGFCLLTCTPNNNNNNNDLPLMGELGDNYLKTGTIKGWAEYV